MRIVIRAVPQRQGNVSKIHRDLIDQGFPQDDIFVRWDEKLSGPLPSWLDCLKFVKERFIDKSEKIIFLQDDVKISSSFAAMATSDIYDDDTTNDMIFCGFASEYDVACRSGIVEGRYAWYSFPCIIFTVKTAIEFLRWYEYNKNNRDIIEWAHTGKNDDLIFHSYIIDTDKTVCNVNPNLVDHRDDLCGGSIVSPNRDKEIRSLYFKE